jgi:hypothetical protein
MVLFASALALSGLLLAGALLSKRRQRRRALERRLIPDLPEAEIGTPSEERSLASARPGDVVLLDRCDLLVLGVVRFEDPPRLWSELRVEDSSGERWIVVDRADPQHVLVGRRVELEGIPGEPSEQIEHAGSLYRLERRGHATRSSTGEAGFAQAEGRCGCFDYARPGSARLWIRRGEGGLLAFAGERVPAHTLTFLPAS